MHLHRAREILTTASKTVMVMCDAANASFASEPLQASLAEEERMAEWVASNVENVTRAYMSRERKAA